MKMRNDPANRALPLHAVSHHQPVATMPAQPIAIPQLARPSEQARSPLVTSYLSPAADVFGDTQLGRSPRASPGTSWLSRSPSPSAPLPHRIEFDSQEYAQLAKALQYRALPRCVLSSEQLASLPPFDLEQGERGREPFHKPVAIIIQDRAWLYSLKFFMQCWRLNQAHPHTRIPLTPARLQQVLFRVDNDPAELADAVERAENTAFGWKPPSRESVFALSQRRFKAAF